MHAVPHSQFPPLVSHCSPSSFPFVFTPLCLSYLCHSQSSAMSCSLSTLCHQAATCYTPFHIYVPLSLLLLFVSLSLIVFFLISCHLISPSWHLTGLMSSLPLTHSMHFCMHPHFYLLIHICPSLFVFLTYAALLSYTSYRNLYLCGSEYKAHKLLKLEDVYTQSLDVYSPAPSGKM